MEHPIEILFKVNKDCIMGILHENLDRPQRIQKIKSIQKGLNDSINEFLFTMQNNHDKLTDYEIMENNWATNETILIICNVKELSDKYRPMIDFNKICSEIEYDVANDIILSHVKYGEVDFNSVAQFILEL